MQTFDPFPQIPRFPNEPLPEGLPASASESAFYDQTGEANLVIEVLDDLAEFENLPSKTQERKFIAAKLKELLSEPERLKNYLDSLSFIDDRSDLSDLGERFSEHQSTADRFIRLLVENVEGHASGFQYDKDSLAALVRLAANDRHYCDLTLRALKGMFRAQSTEKALIDFLYTFSMAVADTEIETLEGRRALVLGTKVLCFGADTFELGSKNHRVLHVALCSEEDDVLRKRSEIAATQYFLGSLFAKEELAALDAPGDDYDPSQWMGRAQRKLDRIPSRKIPLGDFVKDPHAFGKLDFETLQKWPYSVVRVDAGPLRAKIHEIQSTMFRGEVAVWLPGCGSILLSHNQEGREYVLGFIQRPITDEVITRRDAFGALTLLTPDLTPEQHLALAKDADELKNKIFAERVNFVNRRGHLITIIDPKLRELEFNSILFEVGNPKRNLIVTVNIGSYNFSFELDDRFNFLELETRRPLFIKDEFRGFFEQTVLGYIHEILCTDLIRRTGRSERGGQPTGGSSASSGHAEYFRPQRPGCGFSDTQARLLWRDHEMDLAAINEALGRTKDTGMITYVEALEPDAGVEVTPVKVSAPKATSRLWKVVEKNTPRDT